LIGGKQIHFLGLMSDGHERKFLEEVGSSFAIPHEEEYFSGFSSADLITACGDMALKNFVASRCLSRKLEREDKETKDSSAAAVVSLQTRVIELEKNAGHRARSKPATPTREREWYQSVPGRPRITSHRRGEASQHEGGFERPTSQQRC
jgi:hypothetical protein